MLYVCTRWSPAPIIQPKKTKKNTQVEVFDDKEDFETFEADGVMTYDIEVDSNTCGKEIIMWCKFMTNEEDCNSVEGHPCASVLVPREQFRNDDDDSTDPIRMCLPLNHCQRLTKTECQADKIKEENKGQGRDCEWDSDGNMCTPPSEAQ